MNPAQVENDDFASLLSDFDFTAPEISTSSEEIQLIASKISNTDVLCQQINKLRDENIELKTKLVSIQRTSTEFHELYQREKCTKDKLFHEFNKLKEVNDRLKRDKLDLENELINSESVSKQTIEIESQRIVQLDDHFWALCQTLKNNSMLIGDVKKHINAIAKVVGSPQHEYNGLKISEKKTKNVDTSTEDKPRSTVNRGTTTTCFIQKHDVGTSFPEESDILVDDILKNMIIPKILSPIHEPKIFMDVRNCGTQTKIKNVTSNLDYMLEYEDPSLIPLKREQASMINSVSDLTQNPLGPPINPNLSALWQVIGQMIFSTVGSGQIFENNSNMRDLTSEVVRIAERMKNENEIMFQTTETTTRKRRLNESTGEESYTKQKNHDTSIQNDDEFDDLQLLSASMQDEIYDIRLDPQFDEDHNVERSCETRATETSTELDCSLSSAVESEKEPVNQLVVYPQIKKRRMPSNSTALDVRITHNLEVDTSEGIAGKNYVPALIVSDKDVDNQLPNAVVRKSRIENQRVLSNQIPFEVSPKLKIGAKSSRSRPSRKRLSRIYSTPKRIELLVEDHEFITKLRVGDELTTKSAKNSEIVISPINVKSFSSCGPNETSTSPTLDSVSNRPNVNKAIIKDGSISELISDKIVIESKTAIEPQLQNVLMDSPIISTKFEVSSITITKSNIDKSEIESSEFTNLSDNLLEKSNVPIENQNRKVQLQSGYIRVCHKPDKLQTILPVEVSSRNQQVETSKIYRDIDIASEVEVSESTEFLPATKANISSLQIESGLIKKLTTMNEFSCSISNELTINCNIDSDTSGLFIKSPTESQCSSPDFLGFTDAEDENTESDDEIFQILATYKPLLLIEPLIQDCENSIDSPAEPDDSAISRCNSTPIIPTDRKLPRNMGTQQAASPLESIIKSYSSKYRDKIMKRAMPPPSTPGENIVRRKIKDMLTNFVKNIGDALWTDSYVEKMKENIYGLLKHHNYRLLIKIILEYVEALNIKSDELNYEFTPPAPALPRPLQKIISLVEILLRNKSLLINELERKIFSFTSKLDVHELSNLTYFYVGLVDYHSEHVPKLRLFIYKCLYYYGFKAVPMIYIVLSSYPFYNIIPINDDPVYAKNEPLINTIIALLLNINDRSGKIYKSKMHETQVAYKKELLFNLLTKKLHYRLGECHMEEFVVKLFEQLQNNEHLGMIPYCFIIISKRYGYKWSVTNILQRHLWPYLNGILKTVNSTNEYDNQIISILYTISSILKTCDNADDIVVPLNQLFCILNLTQKSSIHQSVLEAILRLSRFSYMEVYNRVIQCQARSQINRRLLLMMKTFVHRKPLIFWKNLQNNC